MTATSFSLTKPLAQDARDIISHARTQETSGRTNQTTKISTNELAESMPTESQAERATAIRIIAMPTVALSGPSPKSEKMPGASANAASSLARTLAVVAGRTAVAFASLLDDTELASLVWLF
jgi:hypothetical protein